MNGELAVPQPEIESLYQRLNREAQAGGYHLNPDAESAKELVKGLLVNGRLYGYWACPCRLASGDKKEDLDIMCPCDYRDPDISDYGTCYCGLYVSEAVVGGERGIASIPERRPPLEEREKAKSTGEILSSLPLPVWRCRVCGYLCARNAAPEVCPVCKAKKERFERFI
jgi:ferredoxin-thioredoxin reductase catalytic subunit